MHYETIAHECDFLIVGGGTSGLVLANRLSEDPKIQVLVLEAGENLNSDPRVQIPGLYDTLKETEADWGFTSTAQTGLHGRQVNLSQGRALGGSSTINAQVFVPPSRTVIDTWETLGNPAWNWSTMEQYYKKVYSLSHLDNEAIDYLGAAWLSEKCNYPAGPVQTSFTTSVGDPIARAWLDTFRTLGYHTDENPFSGTATGAFHCLSSIDPVTKERCSAATAYYSPVSDRPNLHVLTGSLVSRILIEKRGSKVYATGAELAKGDHVQVIKAQKEVVLAAGVFQSPKLLELSGIGGRDLMRTHGLEVHIDNPNVGENLQDHIFCGVSFQVKEHLQTMDDLFRKEASAIQAAMTAYQTNKSGPLASVGIASYAYLPVMDFLSGSGRDDMMKLLEKFAPEPMEKRNYPSHQYYQIAKSILSDPHESSAAFLNVPTQTNITIDPDSDDKDPLPGKHVSIGAVLCQPLSRGSVHITSADPSKHPIIDPKYLSHPLDLEILARHIRYIDTIATTQPFQSLLEPLGRRRGPKSMDLDSVKGYVQRTGISMWHPTSTCSMLPREKGGVVDDRLVVYGTANLRIVDASIMPLIPRANIQSSVYAVAERAADIIKGDYGLKSL